MKKKLLSLFALLCLVLPACIGLVGCGSSKSDAEIITTALDQVANIFIEKGKALNEMTVETYTGNENIATAYISFEDFASQYTENKSKAVELCAQIATCCAVAKGAYSNETLKKYFESYDYDTLSVCSLKDNETNMYDTMLDWQIPSIDRENNKISCGFYTYGGHDYKLEINYDFNKNEVLSFELGFDEAWTSDAPDCVFIHYENSALSIAYCEFNYLDDAQTEFDTLTADYKTWYRLSPDGAVTAIMRLDVYDNDGSFYTYFSSIEKEVNDKIYPTATTE